MIRFYGVDENEIKHPTNTRFYLHNHNEYEIYMFLEGDSRYVVEGKYYSLSPGDIIVIRKQEMHRVYHNSDTKYRRLVLWVAPEFFEKYGCPDYEYNFLKKASGNKISADIVHSSGLYDAIMRLKKYSDNYQNIYSPITDSVVIEILYIINNIPHFEATDAINLPVKKVIDYINKHFTNEITLDTLCEKFFISKYHLCRTFKQSTGMTIQMYIKQKRITLVGELKKEGKSLSEAAAAAGFKDYSSFYRAYVKRYGKSPRKNK